MRVACYERVSSKEQAMHGLSLGDQRKVLEEWCKNNGHVIVDHYCDAGVSGRMPLKKRPELLRMLEDVKNGKIQLVIFIKLDRFFRNVGQYFLANDVLEAHKVPWKAILEDYETETAAGRLKVTIMLGIAQNEAETTSERLKFTFSQMRERGESTNGKCAFGVSCENKVLVPGEDAHIVTDMFNHFVGSRNISETRQWVEEKYNIYITYHGIRKMLDRETYLKTGIVPAETWNSVHEIIKKRAPRQAKKNIYLFSGLAVCAECGKSLNATTRDRWVYYRCSQFLFNRSCSHSHGISETEIEKTLLNSILAEVDNYNAQLKLRKKQEKKQIDPADIQKKKDKLADLYINDRISKEKYEAEYAKLDAIVIEPEKKEIDREKVVSALDFYGQLTKQGKKQFWGSLVEKISIDNDKNITIDLLY